MSGIGFELLKTDGMARRGRVATAHGSFETPAFMPVGTAATVKGLTPEWVRWPPPAPRCVLGNTYHLMLRPSARSVSTQAGRTAPLS